MPRCGDSGTCSCIIHDGVGTQVSGSGSSIDPYRVNLTIVPVVAVADTPTIDMHISGEGTILSPFIISGDVTATLGELSDVADTAAAVNDVLTWTGFEWAPVAPGAIPPGSIFADAPLDGDGSTGDHLKLDYNTTYFDVSGGELVLTTAYIGTPGNTPLTVVKRDSLGNFESADPVSAGQVATRNYVDTLAGVSGATTPLTLVRRDASGRVQTAAPSASSDAANKSYVDTQDKVGNALVTIVDGANLSTDRSLGDRFGVTLGASGRILDNPTNLQNGQAWTLAIRQPASGGPYTWPVLGSKYVYTDTVPSAPLLSTGANKVDVVTFYYDGYNDEVKITSFVKSL